MRSNLFHSSWAKQELLCLKSPTACLSMACMRLSTSWSGISHWSSTMSRCPVAQRVIRASLPTFTLHLPISILNDGLFLSGPWLMMSNPKIPFNTVFVLSHSRATSFHSCLPCFTLTGTACLPPPEADGTDGGWRAAPLAESQCQETVRWRRTAKKKKGREGCCLASWLSFSVLPPPPAPFPTFMLIVSTEKEHRQWHAIKRKKNRWHLSVPHTNTIAHTHYWEEPGVGRKMGKHHK